MSCEQHDCCQHGGAGVDGFYQTIKEMDFAKGPWGAAADGEYQDVKKYLENGGEPNVRDSAGYTPLHYSARNGQEEISKMLLSYGASVNALTRAGKATPLHRAALNNATPVVALLLKHSADPCMQDADGKTPLHKAVEAKNGEICKMLIDYNPKCQEIQDKYGKEAKHYVGGTLEYSEVYKAVKWRKPSEQGHRR